MDYQFEFHLTDEEATHNFGAKLAHCLSPGNTVFLKGELGAGKTTLVRAILRELGYQGSVKSPTYTLVETYELPTIEICHFDLYRLKLTDELLAIGFNDYFTANNLVLIEWPELAEALLPKPQLLCEIKVINSGRIMQLTTDDSNLAKQMRAGN